MRDDFAKVLFRAGGFAANSVRFQANRPRQGPDGLPAQLIGKYADHFAGQPLEIPCEQVAVDCGCQVRREHGNPAVEVAPDHQGQLQRGVCPCQHVHRQTPDEPGIYHVEVRHQVDQRLQTGMFRDRGMGRGIERDVAPVVQTQTARTGQGPIASGVKTGDCLRDAAGKIAIQHKLRVADHDHVPRCFGKLEEHR